MFIPRPRLSQARFVKMRELAYNGNDEAQITMAWAYLWGETVGADNLEADRWIAKASVSAALATRYDIAKIELVRSDYRDDTTMRQLAAEKYPPSIYCLAYMMLERDSSAKGKLACMPFFDLAAASGHLPAKAALLSFQISNAPFWKKGCLVFSLAKTLLCFWLLLGTKPRDPRVYT